MKRILINATQNEEIRVALCKGNHLYDFDLENRTREQKKSNIYKAHVTRVEPSLEAVFVEYGSQRQGFLPIREISNEYLSGNPRDENIKKLIKEGDELIVQVEKEERGNKGAALSTYISLAGRYLVLMPNNPRGGGISRQISGKLREDMKRMLGNLDLPKGMSVIIRTAGIGKTQEDLQHDLNHLLNIWQAILEQNKKFPSPRLVHQEAGVVTRAVRDYLRDDISEIWIDNENAYIEAANFIDAVMPKQADKLRKYADYEPMFARFNIEKQIETAYQREVRLPSGGSIVIDQTEALVSIDINSAKSTKGSDVAETAYHTNLEAADEIARQLRLRDMGGLIVIDFIDMNDSRHQKEVEKRLVEATKYDRARVQFGEISKFGLMEMSRQRLRPSLEESTGYICPRCHGNGMIRDLRSLSLSIMRQIEQIALKERQGEVQAEVPTDIAAFLLNEKRDSLVYLEQDSGTRITILPHAHLESPNFKLHFNRDGFAPSSYERITDTQQQEFSDLGYDVDWQTADAVRPEQQPTRKPRSVSNQQPSNQNNQSGQSGQSQASAQQTAQKESRQAPANPQNGNVNQAAQKPVAQKPVAQKPATPAVAWLSNLFAQAPQATLQASVSSNDAASAIETLVNSGAQSLGAFGQVDSSALQNPQRDESPQAQTEPQPSQKPVQSNKDEQNGEDEVDDRRKRKPRKTRTSKPRARRDRDDNEAGNDNAARNRNEDKKATSSEEPPKQSEDTLAKRKPNSQRSSRGKLERGEPLAANAQNESTKADEKPQEKAPSKAAKTQNPDEVVLQINEAPPKLKAQEVVHLSLDEHKPAAKAAKPAQKPSPKAVSKSDDSESQVTAKASEPKKDAKAAPVIDTEKADRANHPDEPSKSTPKAADTQEKSDESSATSAKGDVEKSSSKDAEWFADRYVTAHKFGKANNDPRVVRQQETKAAPSAAAVRPALSGSVGDFIHATLPDAADKLSQLGIIRSFIEAVSKVSHQDQAQSAEFSFVNYGYAPLANDYLAQFDAMIAPVSQFATAQGKTAVTPRAIGQRASNDPRGQHPDYQDTAKPQAAPEANSQAETRDNSVSASETQGDSSAANHEAPSADAHNVAASALSAESKADDVSANSETLLKADEAIHQNLPQESAQAETHGDDSTDVAAKADDDQVDVQTMQAKDEAKDDSQSAKSKTTIASYKNMIENVAEQLLPQTGMFNLTTPKVPKARTRKAKAEHKKPTQAEKVEAAQNVDGVNDVNSIDNNDHRNDDDNASS